ncbi:MarR family transcriptional regulator [Paenibacillus spiritus]|uniref:MarR family transcriptional regulator n=1 Tax=Paenibacillus spiritus TaxID=2496557 RepID=A0A5J5GJH7_9BACL|nr:MULTISPECIES: MarR family transcriptional regulator [Paenibacillus]KAA9008409.1 MarR family transcriptional regulator [Paenibacillus spiritus]
MAFEQDQLVEEIALSMFRVQKRIISGMSLTKELGLTFPQFSLLTMISKRPGARVVQLAERMDVKSSAVTVMLDRMEAIGLVAREPDEHDRRAVVVNITTKGEQVLREGREQLQTTLSEQLAILKPEELELFASCYRMLERQER